MKFRIFILIAAASLALQTQKKASLPGAELLHYLDYIAADYQEAVQQGSIADHHEYEEMLEFSENIAELLDGAPQQLRDNAARLRKQIIAKKKLSEIQQTVASLKPGVISHFRVRMAPDSMPDLGRGKELYNFHCRGCHGDNGRGDGVIAHTLDHHPTNFHSPEKVRALSPYQVYNTLLRGIEGTSMRAFEELSAQEAWDLSFYVLSLPAQLQKNSSQKSHSFKDLPIDINSLASHNNRELNTILATQVSDPSEALGQLRRAPSLLPKLSSTEHLAKARNVLSEAINLEPAKGILLIQTTHQNFVVPHLDSLEKHALAAPIEQDFHDLEKLLHKKHSTLKIRARLGHLRYLLAQGIEALS